MYKTRFPHSSILSTYCVVLPLSLFVIGVNRGVRYTLVRALMLWDASLTGYYSRRDYLFFKNITRTWEVLYL